MTVPYTLGGTRREVFFHGRDFSPKMDIRSFSSGDSSLNFFSSLGVFLPTKMSLGATFVPMRAIPYSSKCFRREGFSL